MFLSPCSLAYWLCVSCSLGYHPHHQGFGINPAIEALELPSSTTSTMPGVTIGSSGLVPSLELDVLVHCVLSPHSPDGDIIDCVHISHQLAFDHPFLQNHTIQMRPSFHPEGVYDESKVAKPDSNKRKR
ncbi:hypothetical protein J5N97_009356 [Dioscorea zingiberensis]|uniref:Neprosin activation peptide domain-containing protein n=1 Tax=Dioscorea zingiberensis TaxID=325984 RepID=A0A9D5CX15_9LILI|nr:hypothetical protein J5N97_009356 [Dioscorea zingiberensis]